MTSPTAEMSETGIHTVELRKRFLNPKVSEAVLESLTCRCVTCQLVGLTSAPLTSPSIVPPAPITFFPESLSTFTKKFTIKFFSGKNISILATKPSIKATMFVISDCNFRYKYLIAFIQVNRGSFFNFIETIIVYVGLCI